LVKLYSQKIMKFRTLFLASQLELCRLINLKVVSKNYFDDSLVEVLLFG